VVLKLERADTNEVTETVCHGKAIGTLVGCRPTRLHDIRRLSSVDASLSLNIAHKRGNIV
jgi:hypothetical protein